MSVTRWLGIGFIIVGVWLVARSCRHRRDERTLPHLPFARPTIDDATAQDVADVLRSGWITSGPQGQGVRSRAVGARVGGRPVRVVSSATAALEIALEVCGIGPGDEVITPAMTFFAAPNMIVKVGATPVFVDVEPGTRNLDLAAAAARIGPRTKAIMPTHFAGLPCDMDALYALAAAHKLRVIEDAALAIGSSWQGKPIGSFGDICVFSFHPNKNITSIEGGALVVNDEREARDVEVLRFHGIARLPDGTRDVAGARRQVQPARRERRGRPAPARAPAGVQRAAARTRRPLFRALPHRPAVRAAASRLSRRRGRAQLEHVRAAAAARGPRDLAARRSATRSTRAASAPACRTRPRISRPRTGGSAIIAATFPSPSTSPTPP